MPNVSHVRSEVAQKVKVWKRISDCIAGQDAIKAGKENYLPKPQADDMSEENRLRYESYLDRAIYYNMTGRTLAGLVGQVFGRDSTIEMPTILDALSVDAQGDGVSLEQQAKRTLEFILSFGHAGILADYPIVDAPTTKAQQDSGEIRPISKLYRPEDIINWRTKVIGAKVVLCLVVLVEMQDEEDDGFEVKQQKAYRVLRLDENNNYTVQIFTEKEAETGFDSESVKPIEVKDFAGKNIKEIPFTFVGVDNNDHTIDDAPLNDLAVLNIGHYRNSADFEESCFVVGQPTAWASGLTEEWVNNVLKGTIALGSRGFLPLPRDAQAGLLQADPNNMPFEAMKQKESQAKALGSKLVEDRSVQRTLGEANIDNDTENSILSLLSNAENLFLEQNLHLNLN